MLLQNEHIKRLHVRIYKTKHATLLGMKRKQELDPNALREALAIARLDYDVKEIAEQTQLTRQTIAGFLGGARVNISTFRALETWATTAGYLPRVQSQLQESPAYYHAGPAEPFGILAADLRSASDFALTPYLDDQEKIDTLRERFNKYSEILDKHEKKLQAKNK